MREIVWRIDDTTTSREVEPKDPAGAKQRLEAGNRAFAELFDEGGLAKRIMPLSPADLGLSVDGTAPQQRPFATLLSCADARVPVELLLNQRANDLFVVRVAGGVLSEAALGSLDFAVDNLSTMRLVVALGHTGCGAVDAAVTTYLDPPAYLSLADSRPLLALVQNLFGSVRLADHALHHVHGSAVVNRPGYRRALNDLAVVASAATSASSLAMRIAQRSQPGAGQIATVYGVYDLVSRRIGVPGTTSTWTPGLVASPDDGAALMHTLNEVAFGPHITVLLDTPSND
jgi:carbonic anhydrase